MNQNARQRIVGTVVLLLVAVILLPLVFNGEGDYRQPPLEPRIPEPPATPAVPETDNERPSIAADADDDPQPAVALPAADDDGNPDAPADAEQTGDSDGDTEPVADAGAEAGGDVPEGPGLDSEGLPRGWSVRLGAFSNSDNVDNLLERLRDSDYAAYTRDIDGGGRQLTAVFVGPRVDRSEAQALLQELQDRFDLQGRVERYRIDDL